MHIKKITERHRRDFYCIYECEHCNFEIEGNGYDDRNFHVKVIPSMKCNECGKHSDSDIIEIETKWKQEQII